ncbi:MAG: NAD(P)H-dependent oxidoreductase subunit E, partial [Tepidiformaceae bacterium]
MSVRTPMALPERSRLLPELHARSEADGWLSRQAVVEVARTCRIPVAEAWEAATSYPEFAFEPPASGRRVCMGLSCVLNGARVGTGEVATGCQFRCAEAPAPGVDAPFLEASVRRAGPLLA